MENMFLLPVSEPLAALLTEFLGTSALPDSLCSADCRVDPEPTFLSSGCAYFLIDGLSINSKCPCISFEIWFFR